MADLSLTIDLLLQGAQQIANLRREIDALGKTSARVNQQTSKTKTTRGGTGADSKAATAANDAQAKAARRAADEEEKAAAATLRHAQAIARLQSTAGQNAAALQTLKAALDQVNQKTTAAVRAQTQMVQIQNKIANEAQRAERAIIQQAFATARLQQSQGNAAGAANTLRAALAKVTPGTLAAGRAQKYLNDLTTDYANSPLISSVRGITSAVGQLFPSLRGLAGGFGQAAAGAEGLATASGVAGVALGVVGAAVLAVAAAIAVVVAAGSGFVSLLQTIGSEGVRANAQLEQVRLGIASVASSVATVRDSKGIELQGLDALQATLPIADDLLRKLRVRSLETALSFEDLSQGLLQALGPGLAAGLSGDQILDTVVSLSQLVGPLTGNVKQLGQELRALLSGDIKPQSAQVATALGISSEDIKRAKEAGRLAEFLNERLKVAAATGALLGKTFDAARTNLQEAGTIFSTEVTRGFFDKFRDSINRVLPTLFDAKSANLLSAKLQGVADTFTRIFDVLGGEVSDLIDFLVNGIVKVSEFLDNNRQTVAEIVQIGDEIIRQIAAIVGDLLGAGETSQTWAERLKGVGTLLRLALGFVFAMRSQLRLVVNGFVLLGNVIRLAVITPLLLAAKAAAAITSGIPILGEAAASIANRVQGFFDASVSSIKAAGSSLAGTVKEVGDAAIQSSKRIKQAGIDAQNRTARNQKKADDKFAGAKLSPRKKTKEDEDEKKQKEATAKQLFDLEQKAREASLQLRRAQADAALELAKQADEEETASLDRALNDRLISLDAYYRRRIELSASATAREVANLEARLEEERQALAIIRAEGARAIANSKPGDRRKTEVDVLKEVNDQTARILDLETQLNGVQVKGRTQVAELDAARLQQLRQLGDAIRDIESQLLEATGRGLEASARQIADRFREVLKDAIVNFGADSAQVLAIKNLQAALLAQAQLREQNEALSRSQTSLDTARARIQGDLLRGTINERQARQEILAAERAKRPELEKNLALQLKIAEALGDPNAIANIKRQQEELKQLGVDGETALRKIQRSIEDGVTDALDDLFSRAKSLGDIFKGLLQTVLKTISRLAAEEITDAVFNRKPRNGDATTKQSGLSGVLDKIFGRNKTATDKTTEAVKGTTKAVDSVEVQTIPRLDEIIRLLQRIKETGQRTENNTATAAAGGAQGGGGIGSILSGVGGGLLGSILGGVLRQKTTSDVPIVRGEDGSILEGGEVGGGLPDKLSALFNRTISTLGGFFSKTFGGLFSGLKNVFGGALDGFSSVFSGLFKGIGGLFSGGGGLGSVIGKVGSFLKPVLSVVGSFFGFGGFADGGRVIGPGSGRSDSIIARLSNDEHVMTAKASRTWGHDIFDAINAGLLLPSNVFGFADGGAVGDALSSGRQEISITSKDDKKRNLSIFNVFDSNEMLAALETTGGEDVFFNVLRRNKTRARQVLGF